MKTASLLLLPAGLLALAAFVLNLPGPRPEELASVLRAYPWVVLVVGLLLALRFRRGNVVLALAALAIADRVLLRFPPGTAGEAAAFAFNSTAVLLPLDLLWLALVRERGAFTPTGVLRAFTLAAQPALVAFLWLSYQPRLVAALGHPFLPDVLPASGRLAHSSQAAFAAAFAVIAVTWWRRKTPLEAGFMGALAASLLALTSAAPDAPGTYLATGGLILVVCVVEATFAMAYRDGLTGLPGRRAFDEALAKLSGRYTIAMLDIDHFKAINDEHGHDNGDQVLRMVAARLAGFPGARAFRVGGEEFALLFPGRPCSAVRATLDELRGAIAEGEFAVRGEDRPRKKPKRVKPRTEKPLLVRVTVSVGAAESGGALAAAEEVVRAADEALYRAKRAGRNRVVT